MYKNNVGLIKLILAANRAYLDVLDIAGTMKTRNKDRSAGDW